MASTGCNSLGRRLECYDEETNEQLMSPSTYVWPYTFTHFDATASTLPSRFGANHSHAVPDDILAELGAVRGFLELHMQPLDQHS